MYNIGQKVVFSHEYLSRPLIGIITGKYATYSFNGSDFNYEVTVGGTTYHQIKEYDICEYTEKLKSVKLSKRDYRIDKNGFIMNGDFSEPHNGWSDRIIADKIIEIIKEQKGSLRFDESFLPKYAFQFGYDKNGRGFKPMKFDWNRDRLDALNYSLGLYTSSTPRSEYKPSKVFFNDKKKATTLMFGNEATVVKCGEGDKYDKRIGFLEAYFQATCGMSKNKANKYLKKIVEESEDVK